MKKVLIFSVIAFILIVASITNPSKDNFIYWAKEELKQENELVLNLGIEFIGDEIINLATNTENFVFFSIFKSKVPNNEKIKVLGIFNNFIPLSKSILNSKETITKQETDLPLVMNATDNNANESNITILDFQKDKPIKNVESFTYNEENKEMPIKLKDGDTNIYFGKDHPNGIQIMLIRGSDAVQIDLGEVDDDILDAYGDLADIENYSIQVGTHDFNNDGIEEIIITIGDGLFRGQVWVYSYHKVDDIHKIYPLHLELKEYFQNKVWIEDNKFLLPYGSQGLFEKFTWYEDGFMQ